QNSNKNAVFCFTITKTLTGKNNTFTSKKPALTGKQHINLFKYLIFNRYHMNSPFANIYLAIQQQILSTVLNPDNTPMIASIDQDLGQLDFYKIRPSVSFP